MYLFALHRRPVLVCDCLFVLNRWEMTGREGRECRFILNDQDKLGEKSGGFSSRQIEGKMKDGSMR